MQCKITSEEYADLFPSKKNEIKCCVLVVNYQRKETMMNTSTTTSFPPPQCNVKNLNFMLYEDFK